MRALLIDLFDTAVVAVAPERCLPAHLPAPPKGRTAVFAYGKAAASMAATVERHWPGPIEGIAVTRDEHGVPLDRIDLIEARHPHPDDRGAAAARAMLALAATLGPDDLALCLASGGGSALTSLPVAGVSAEDKRAVLRTLVASGAPIGAINRVRRRLSAFKGGRLGAACAPARVHTLVISDVPGDDPALVASGPTFAACDETAAIREVLRRYGVSVPATIARALEKRRPPLAPFAHSFAVVARARDALDAAAARCAALGVPVVNGSDRVEGEARDVARRDAAAVRARLDAGERGPLVLLSGGETAVTVTGTGRGGRNAEYLAALAIALEGASFAAIACDTDGIDGSEDNAGAFADGTTVARARALGLDPAALLENNDAYRLFSGLGDLMVTGPTRTNVNDFRAILIGVPA